ncbi:YgcG family protein [Novosphingobium sp. AP12]|uniref:TPM domain-containing protein n=1 Tax=Novosphingobium sp. AP12 TaxID=1144305 RepID=UPI001EE669C1|nr:TPM domain-containing protein [Novosphingobium sp. AP12]
MPPAPFTESTTQPAGEALRLQGRVNDAAGLLDEAAERRLADRLRTLEDRTGHQMVVVTAPSLGGKDIAEYTLDLARRWGIGREGHDDGVVVLVAPGERRVRIEVGRGLEKTLPFAVCYTVIQHDMLPRFTSGDFAGGLDHGTASLIAKLI